MIENYFSFFCTILCKNLDSLLHVSCILVRKKLEKRLCLTETRGHPVIITKNTPKKGTKKAETLKFFEHFDYLLIGVTGFEPAASWSRRRRCAFVYRFPAVLTLSARTEMVSGGFDSTDSGYSGWEYGQVCGQISTLMVLTFSTDFFRNLSKNGSIV